MIEFNIYRLGIGGFKMLVFNCLTNLTKSSILLNSRRKFSSHCLQIVDRR